MNDKDIILKRLREDLIGPYAENEILTAYPSDYYLTGILFPQKEEMDASDSNQLQTEGGGHQDPSDTANDEVSLATIKKPASAGISFVVSELTGKPVINLFITAARYEKIDVSTKVETTEKSEEQHAENKWKRIPIELKLQITVLSKPQDLSLASTVAKGLGVHIRASKLSSSEFLVTAALINENRNPETYERYLSEERAFFQTSLAVECEPGTEFKPRPLSASAIDEDTRANALIYRNVREYATGHTCAAEWRKKDGLVDRVSMSWLPLSEVKAMSSQGTEEFQPLTESGVLSTKWIAEAKGKELIDGLLKVPQLYLSWCETQRSKISALPEDLANQAILHLDNAKVVAYRMMGAIESIRTDEKVQLAFRLANRSIMLQREWASPEEKTPLTWRPFQLGFILLTLDSLANENNPDRNVADLLWFPTGGGKTEAYLGLIAFNLFLRRYRYGENGAGVTSFMRYTLRLLTVQQFQRATTLICACEYIRQVVNSHKGQNVLGETSFSIGLWVGSDTTPNTHDDACSALTNETSKSTPKQLTFCPRHKGKLLNWSINTNPKQVQANCPVEDCLWHKSPLPVWTVDEYVYHYLPSLVIGTIDKFAQVTRNKKTGRLFGHGTHQGYRQPDLIIQDELHLISGPLGTMTGLYEVAIDELCTRGHVRPKIVASTATIRQASAQISALFDRQTCLFPPPILDAGNSGFAVEDQADPGRLYAGITTAGRSSKFTLQAATASLLQSVSSKEISDDVRDDFWTQVTYFNSLRELGGALVLMQDDVVASISDYAARRNNEAKRELREIMELTSRVSSAEIKECLEQLDKNYSEDGACDSVLASNMISVGVDVSRLGVMIVNGQPKGISEYIQATSRVGRRRGGPGGLVLAIYNNAKARDRSHFESFCTWHMALYKDVEATSVTPFAPRARQKALHAVLVILARHLLSGMNDDPSAAERNHEKLSDLVEKITERAKNIDPEEALDVENELELFLERWLANSAILKHYWNDRSQNSSLMISAERAAEIRSRKGDYYGKAMPTPNSMRNVEPGTLFVLEERLRKV